MAIIAIHKDEYKEFSLVEDVDEDKTIFILSTFDTFERSHAEWKLRKSKENDDTVNVSIWIYDMLRLGLKGWRNLKDVNGNDIEFKTTKFKVGGKGNVDVISDECINMLKYEWVEQIALELYRMAWLTDEQKKS